MTVIKNLLCFLLIKEVALSSLSFVLFNPAEFISQKQTNLRNIWRQSCQSAPVAENDLHFHLIRTHRNYFISQHSALRLIPAICEQSDALQIWILLIGKQKEAQHSLAYHHFITVLKRKVSLLRQYLPDSMGSWFLAWLITKLKSINLQGVF